MDEEIFTIALTLGWSYNEILDMYDDERKKWFQYCVEYHDKMSNSLKMNK